MLVHTEPCTNHDQPPDFAAKRRVGLCHTLRGHPILRHLLRRDHLLGPAWAHHAKDQQTAA
jgi:hypothetical protein